MSCDTETCETCGAETLAGNDEQGRCVKCAEQPDALLHLLRLSVAGVTRDRKSGRFERASSARKH